MNKPHGSAQLSQQIRGVLNDEPICFAKHSVMSQANNLAPASRNLNRKMFGRIADIFHRHRFISSGTAPGRILFEGTLQLKDVARLAWSTCHFSVFYFADVKKRLGTRS
jgi:hypothetical protein